MQLQLLSDLHLETESFDPVPAPQAELLVLAGDVDSTWAGYERFAGWPVPVIVVAGNHEFDGRDFDAASQGLRDLCARLGFTLLERESLIHTAADGRRIRLVGTTRWSDFDLFGPERQGRALRAAEYFLRLMATTRHGRPFDAAAVREHSWPAANGWKHNCSRRPWPLGQDGGDHSLCAQPAQRRPTLRPTARHGQLLQCRRRPDPARRPVAARPPALPARLPCRVPGARPRGWCATRGLRTRANTWDTTRCSRSTSDGARI
jgi:hypothetical protein